MARYRRPKRCGATVFFTVCLAGRGQSLLVDEITRMRAAVRTVWMRHPFVIDAWVVLPDHMHAIWTLPDGDRAYGQRWGAIKAGFSRGLPKRDDRPSLRARGESGLWQRRFWEHHIRDADDLAVHKLYCWLDPVRHGLVARPDDWRYSSYHRDRVLAEATGALDAGLPRFPTGEPAGVQRAMMQALPWRGGLPGPDPATAQDTASDGFIKHAGLPR